MEKKEKVKLMDGVNEHWFSADSNYRYKTKKDVVQAMKFFYGLKMCDKNGTVVLLSFNGSWGLTIMNGENRKDYIRVEIGKRWSNSLIERAVKVMDYVATYGYDKERIDDWVCKNI